VEIGLKLNPTEGAYRLPIDNGPGPIVIIVEGLGVGVTVGVNVGVFVTGGVKPVVEAGV
jgi:hypothetical protein